MCVDVDSVVHEMGEQNTPAPIVYIFLPSFLSCSLKNKRSNQQWEYYYL